MAEIEFAEQLTAPHRINLGVYHTLRHLLHGVLDRSYINQINACCGRSKFSVRGQFDQSAALQGHLVWWGHANGLVLLTNITPIAGIAEHLSCIR